MAETHLIEGRIKAFRPRKTARGIRDANLKAIGVRVCPTERKCHFIHTQHNGQRIWKTVGDATGISLAEARQRAQTMLAATRSGASFPPDGRYLVRDGCRRGLSSIRAYMEAQDARSNETTTSIINCPGSVDANRGGHRCRCPRMVRLPPYHAGDCRSVRTGPLSHHGSCRGVWISASRKQSMERTGGLLFCRGGPSSWAPTAMP